MHMASHLESSVFCDMGFLSSGLMNQRFRLFRREEERCRNLSSSIHPHEPELNMSQGSARFSSFGKLVRIPIEQDVSYSTNAGFHAAISVTPSSFCVDGVFKRCSHEMRGPPPGFQSNHKPVDNMMAPVTWLNKGSPLCEIAPW